MSRGKRNSHTKIKDYQVDQQDGLDLDDLSIICKNHIRQRGKEKSYNNFYFLMSTRNHMDGMTHPCMIHLRRCPSHTGNSCNCHYKCHRVNCLGKIQNKILDHYIVLKLGSCRHNQTQKRLEFTCSA